MVVVGATVGCHVGHADVGVAETGEDVVGTMGTNVCRVGGVGGAGIVDGVGGGFGPAGAVGDVGGTLLFFGGALGTGAGSVSTIVASSVGGHVVSI